MVVLGGGGGSYEHGTHAMHGKGVGMLDKVIIAMRYAWRSGTGRGVGVGRLGNGAAGVGDTFIL